MVDFVEKSLTRADGEAISYITHMQYGPDGLLYASSLFGTIYAFDVEKTEDDEYVAHLVHEINVLADVPNHDDDGTYRPDVQGRYVMSFDVVGTAENPVIYVSSNDPRIDTNADSNSGALHELTMDVSGEWGRVDLVRGLPRSQHDHLLNGVKYIIDDDGNPAILLNTGGHTNAGAPSAPLQYLPEYSLSGAILKVDLNAVKSLPLQTDTYGSEYYHNLPTVDDPTRAGVNEGVDASIEIFGGNGGLNQAKYDPDGPVTIFASGIRNAIETIETEDGHLLTFDNGGNPSWGNSVIFDTDENSDPIATNLPSESGSATTNQDQLHLVTEGAYLGHPNPIRASGSDAGLYVQDANGTPLPVLPSDWDEVFPEHLEDINQGQFLSEGTEDGALALSSKSTNGLTQYTFDGAFEGEIDGDIFAVRYGTGNMKRFKLVDSDNDGTPDSAIDVETIDLSVGSPFDIYAPRDNEPFHGVLFVSGLVGGTSIRILEPADGSANDTTQDRDEDGVIDTIDPFPYDAANGQNTILGPNDTLFWDFESTTPANELPGNVQGFAVGISGFMSNGEDLPEGLSLDRFDPVIQGGDDVVLGGTANTVLIGATPGGSAEGPGNSQFHGFQAGFNVQSSSFRMTVEAWNPFAVIPDADQSVEQKSGAYLGTGDQDSFVALYIGKGFIELYYEENGVEAQRLTIANASLENVDENVFLTDLIFDVNAESGQLIASFSANTLDGVVTGEFEPIQLYGDLLDAIQGEHKVGGQASGPAWGLIATSGNATPFEANWGAVTLEGSDVASAGAGEVTINVDAISTFDSGSFSVENTGTKDIAKIIFTIDDAFVDDIFFDTDGTGDAGSPKGFTVDSANGVTVTNSDGTAYNALPGGGYQTLEVNFSDFNPGNAFTFSIDIDPRTASGFGSGSPQGAISGLELAGTLVTVEFTDGTSATTELVGTGANSSNAVVNSNLPGGGEIVEISVAGITNGQSSFVTSEQPTVSLNGPANATVQVMIGAGDVLPDDASGLGLLGPLQFNSIEGIQIFDVVLDENGQGSFVADLTDPDATDPNDGVFRIMATVSDGNGGFGRLGSGVTLRYDVTGGTNNAPNAVDDGENVSFEATLSGNVLTNDTDQDGDTLIVTAVNGETSNLGTQITLPSGALLTVNSDGTYSYDPNGQFDNLGVGTTSNDSFTYTIADGNGATDTASVDIVVRGPQPTNLLTAINVGGGDYASVDTNIFYEADPGTSSGSVQIRNKSGNAIAGTQDDPLYQTYAFGGLFSYDFVVPEAGDYVIQIELTEPFWGVTGDRVFDIFAEGTTPGQFDDIDVYALGGTFSAVTLTETVTVTDGVLNIEFDASVDNALVSAIAIFIDDNSTPPTADLADNDAATVAEDSTVLIDVLANDDVTATIDSISSAANGTVVVEAGQIRYTPDADFFGIDTFTYTVTDGVDTDTATVTVDVTAVNDDPEVNALNGTTISETASVGTVVGQLDITEVDGDTLTFTVNDPRFSVNGSYQLVYTGGDLTVDADTPVDLTITADDQNGGVDVFNTQITITDDVEAPEGLVAAINVGGGAYLATETGIQYAADPGISSGSIQYRTKSDAISGTEDDTLYQTYGFGGLFGYDIAVAEAGDYIVQIELTEPFWSSEGGRVFDIIAEGTAPVLFDDIDVFAEGGQFGAVTLTETVTVTDGVLNLEFDASVDNALVSAITVFSAGGTTTPPTADLASDDSATVDEDSTVLVDVLANDDLSASIDSVAAAANGTVVIEGGEIRYTPDADFFGIDSFEYTVTDGVDTDTATVTVDVTAVNDDPEVNSLTGSTIAEDASVGTVVGQLDVTDVDGDTLTFTVDDPRFSVNSSYELVYAGGDISVDADTPVDLTITADDQNGGVDVFNTQITITDQSTPPTGTGGPIAAFNIGGGDYLATETGIQYTTDPGVSSGSVQYRNKSNAIAGTEDDALYQTYAFGSSFSFDFDVPEDGNYVVEVELVETWFNTPGGRLFDISLEGAATGSFDDIDIYAISGASYEAVTLSETVTVTDGILNIDFDATENNAIISGISIWHEDDYLA